MRPVSFVTHNSERIGKNLKTLSEVVNVTLMCESQIIVAKRPRSNPRWCERPAGERQAQRVTRRQRNKCTLFLCCLSSNFTDFLEAPLKARLDGARKVRGLAGRMEAAEFRWVTLFAESTRRYGVPNVPTKARWSMSAIRTQTAPPPHHPPPPRASTPK